MVNKAPLLLPSLVAGCATTSTGGAIDRSSCRGRSCMWIAEESIEVDFANGESRSIHLGKLSKVYCGVFLPIASCTQYLLTQLRQTVLHRYGTFRISLVATVDTTTTTDTSSGIANAGWKTTVGRKPYCQSCSIASG